MNPNSQKPVQSQKNNVKAMSEWTFLQSYFPDFQQVFTDWDTIFLLLLERKIIYFSKYELFFL